VVVTIDHTYDAGQVQFPDGRVEVPALPPLTPEVLTRAVAVRAVDVRFVLDQLTALNAGRNPDAEHPGFRSSWSHAGLDSGLELGKRR
jgi:hypothetical protein